MAITGLIYWRKKRKIYKRIIHCEVTSHNKSDKQKNIIISNNANKQSKKIYCSNNNNKTKRYISTFKTIHFSLS